MKPKTYLDRLQVRYFIRQKNLRQRQVARRLRISEGHVCRLIDGKSPISAEILAALSAILGVPSSKLVLAQKSHHATR